MELLQPSKAVIEKLRDDPRSKILVVGSKDGNFPNDIRNHPQMVFWDSHDPSARKKPNIPKGVVVVIFLKFLSTAWYLKVKDYAKSGGVWFLSHAMQTGEARRLVASILPSREAALAALAKLKAVETRDFSLIFPPQVSKSVVSDYVVVAHEGNSTVPDRETISEEELVAHDELEEERGGDAPVLKPAETKVVVKQKRGSIKAFAYKHFRIGNGTAGDEAHRVCALAVVEDIETTPQYLQVLYYAWRKDPDGYLKTRRVSTEGAKIVRSVASGDPPVHQDLSTETPDTDTFSDEVRSSISEVKAAMDLMGPAIERLAGVLDRFLERPTVDTETEAELTRLRRIEVKFKRLRKDIEDSDQE
ncbi:MAG: hypothetical protein G01um101420_111 [Parcubacteria group bacterium Gr01-1014_20]|nr:MAG: hypothetical protein G01um101420_111 [Parcubacteria group bacterium Gr01-1014_20]